MYKLYSRIADHETILEAWGGSTKHPDSVFYFSDFQKSEYCTQLFTQIFSWLLECASRMMFHSHARSLAEFAFECDEAIVRARKFDMKNLKKSLDKYR